MKVLCCAGLQAEIETFIGGLNAKEIWNQTSATFPSPQSIDLCNTMLGNICESEFCQQKNSQFWEKQVFAKLNVGICESWLKQINAFASISTLKLIYL